MTKILLTIVVFGFIGVCYELYSLRKILKKFSNIIDNQYNSVIKVTAQQHSILENIIKENFKKTNENINNIL